MRKIVLIFLLTFYQNLTLAQNEPLIADTAESACQVLIEKAYREQWFTALSQQDLLCEATKEENDYVFIMSLHDGRPFPPDQQYPHSTLLGWFAVMRRSGLVLEYDVGESRIVELSYKKEAK